MSTVTLRLSKLNVDHLIPALRHVYVNEKNLELTGRIRDAHPEVDIYRGSGRFGTYSPAFKTVMTDLWKRIQYLRKAGGRIYKADVFTIAAGIFLVRASLRKIRHGHHEGWPNYERSAKRFLKKLEVLRKRLKRATICEVGADRYTKAMRHWRSFLRFLRYHHLYCRCSYRRRNNLYRIRRLTLDKFCELAAAELKSRGREVPSALRKLVRRHVSYIRRGRTKYTIPQMMNDPVFAASRLANYIIYGRT